MIDVQRMYKYESEQERRNSKRLREDLDFKTEQHWTSEAEFEKVVKELKELNIQKSIMQTELATLRSWTIAPEELVLKLTQSEQAREQMRFNEMEMKEKLFSA